jgi:hypothetical protein
MDFPSRVQAGGVGIQASSNVRRRAPLPLADMIKISPLVRVPLVRTKANCLPSGESPWCPS